jgi:serine protease Do
MARLIALLRAVLFKGGPLAAVIGCLVLGNSPARADDIPYSQIGWWQIGYRELQQNNGCFAYARFRDQTEIQLELMQFSANDKGWAILIYNPYWEQWVLRKQNHILFFWASKSWRGLFSVTQDNSLMSVDLSTNFINSLADANSLVVMTENKAVIASLDMKDSTAAIQAVVKCVRDHPIVRSPEADMTFSGSGFFVNPNLLITNNHVVSDCGQPIELRYPEQGSYRATLMGQDSTNDLALLHTDTASGSVASFGFQPRLGESVAAYGFPYSDLLSPSGNFTLGNVTALSGMRDDTRFLQMSAPVQPGNSGGPLLDMSGSVIGVVSAILNRARDSQPQNVNFAIRSPIVISFLSSKGVSPKLSAATQEIPPTEIAEIAKSFTVQVYCNAASSKKPVSYDYLSRLELASAARKAPSINLGDLSGVPRGQIGEFLEIKKRIGR